MTYTAEQLKQRAAFWRLLEQAIKVLQAVPETPEEETAGSWAMRAGDLWAAVDMLQGAAAAALELAGGGSDGR